MRIDRFTAKLQTALADAQSLAAGRDHNYLAPVHLVSALLNQQGGSTRPLLAQMGVDIEQFDSELQELLAALPVVKDNYGDIQMSPELNRLLNVVDKYAQQRSDQFISSELVILAALEDRSRSLVGSLDTERRAIHVLTAEWAYLNQPERLAKLVDRHLDLVPLGVDRIMSISAIPTRESTEHQIAAAEYPTDGSRQGTGD